MKKLFRFIKNEEGIEMTEYAIIAALIAIITITGATLLGIEAVDVYEYIGNVLQTNGL